MIRPLQGRKVMLAFDPVALPPAIESVRYADAQTFVIWLPPGCR
ncbi:MAG TPA: hypothetical protein VHD88_05530 [Pyrinomonadaceae bacterium]|nr:hypothetical protein [Pyrinomonadaceae bacterium]